MILFVENNTNFLIYLEIAKVLKLSFQTDCCILTLSKSKEITIQQKGIKAIFLGDLEISRSDKKFDEIVSAIEDKDNNFSVGQYLLQDRHLKYYKAEKRESIIIDYAERFTKFMECNHVDISLIIGELTWANEIIFKAISENLFNIRYVDLLNNYVFDNPRLTFFDDKHTDRYLGVFGKETNKSVINFNIEEFLSKRKSKNINTIFNSFSNYSLIKYIEKYKLIQKYGDSYDYKYDFKIKLIFNLKRRTNKVVNNLLRKFIYDDFEPSENYFYMPLHIQPEATPDVVAPFYNNQIDLIEKVSLALPYNTFLYVKDHPEGVGYRNFNYYLRIKKLPKVKVLSPEEISINIIHSSIGIITIAGTAGIEARLDNKPVIVFSDIFYHNKIDHVYKVTDFNELTKTMLLFKKGKDFKCNNLEQFLIFMHNGSSEGYIYDPIIQPDVLDKENLFKIASFIKRFENLMVYC